MTPTNDNSSDSNQKALNVSTADWLAAVRERTPARIFGTPNGSTLPTRTYLELRADHAAAADAVQLELDLVSNFSTEFVNRWNLIQVRTRCRSRREYLLRPDLGRQFSPDSIAVLRDHCPAGSDIQVVIGDGLSVAAVVRQAPDVLTALESLSAARKWRMGRTFCVQNSRVGILNSIGELLDPVVVVLLVGERPGLATAESLSAYMAYKPRPGHNDANRNLISNIHDRGTSRQEAAEGIVALAENMMRLRTSGVEVKSTRAITATP